VAARAQDQDRESGAAALVDHLFDASLVLAYELAVTARSLEV
jgi:hypothetical protein